VVVHYHNDGAAAEQTVKGRAAGRLAGGRGPGGSDPGGQGRQLFDEAVDTTGMVLRKPILETTEDEYDQMFAINAKAGYFFIQEAGRRLNNGGKIVSLGTSLPAAFTDGYSTYAGGKSPLETLHG
jgi:NAD(P)-dependent dehydrogenase (short-subunit alcohol dehydrogenase family)